MKIFIFYSNIFILIQSIILIVYDMIGYITQVNFTTGSAYRILSINIFIGKALILHISLDYSQNNIQSARVVPCNSTIML